MAKKTYSREWGDRMYYVESDGTLVMFEDTPLYMTRKYTERKRLYTLIGQIRSKGSVNLENDDLYPESFIRVSVKYVEANEEVNVSDHPMNRDRAPVCFDDQMKALWLMEQINPKTCPVDECDNPTIRHMCASCEKKYRARLFSSDPLVNISRS